MTSADIPSPPPGPSAARRTKPLGGSALVVAALLVLGGCEAPEQRADAHPDAMERHAEEQVVRRTADNTRRNRESDARATARVEADSARFERSERESGR